MVFHRAGRLLQLFFPTLTWNRPRTDRTIYLTFDDGPIPGLTEDILAILDEYQVKATFFVVGENVRKHPHIFAQILARGHQVGNHTFNHIKGWSVPNEHYYGNIAECSEILLANGKEKIELFRPPYGRIKRSQIPYLSQHYEIVMWDVLSGDYDRTLPEKTCLAKSVQYTKPGSVVVFHDNVKATRNVLYTLPRYIAHFKKEGYDFGTL